MKVWLEIERPIDMEADLRLENLAPLEVQDVYAIESSGKFIAWVDSEETHFGCIRINRSISVPKKTAESIELYEMEPAKGDGHVGLEVKDNNGECLAVIIHSRYSQKSLSWLKQVQNSLAKAFCLTATYDYQGKDA